MTFKKLLEGLSCPCLDGTKENTADSFMRVLKRQNIQLQENDLQSQWEENKKPIGNDCASLCTNRAISFSILVDNNENMVIKKFEEIFGISPQYKSRYAVKIKFKNDAGKVKQFGDNKYHYDFYKSDQFALQYIDVIETIDLKKHV